MISFERQAWEDYLYWQKHDKAKLKHELAGFWSRRIDHEHRLVYTVQDGRIIIAQCRYHYG